MSVRLSGHCYGHVQATYNLAVCDEKGQGVAACDARQAVQLYQIAAAQGHVDTMMCNLGWFQERGSVLQRVKMMVKR